MYIPSWLLIIVTGGAIYFFRDKIFKRSKSFSIPTYPEMLDLNEEDFKQWLVMRSSAENRESLLEEMVDHEERTHSFRRTAKKELNEGQILALSLFDRNKSKQAMELFNKLNEIDVEGEDPVDKVDLVLNTMMGKAASDYARLADKML